MEGDEFSGRHWRSAEVTPGIVQPRIFLEVDRKFHGLHPNVSAHRPPEPKANGDSVGAGLVVLGEFLEVIYHDVKFWSCETHILFVISPVDDTGITAHYKAIFCSWSLERNASKRF